MDCIKIDGVWLSKQKKQIEIKGSSRKSPNPEGWAEEQINTKTLNQT